MTTEAMRRAMTPCDCRLRREAAMTCPRTTRGQLVFTPDHVVEDMCGQPDGHAPGCQGSEAVGPMRVIDIDGTSASFTLGHEWLHASEGLARDYARVRHLEFVIESA